MTNNKTIYDVQSNGVTIEFTSNFKDAEDAYNNSPATFKKLIQRTPMGTAVVIKNNRNMNRSIQA